MEVTILGCGTSTGVPVVGCNCPICTSDHPRNYRLRGSAVVQSDAGDIILIDTSPDLRHQALTNGVTHIDGVLYTHTHADHIHGIDEMRVYNFVQHATVNIFGAAEHIEQIKQRFSYIFTETVMQGGGKPRIDAHTIDPGRYFTIGKTEILPIALQHGALLSVGFRFGDFAFLTDLNHIPEASMTLLDGVKVAVIGALRWRKHDTHFTIDEAVEMAHRLNLERAILTHFSHEVDYEDICSKLPEGVEAAYDGMHIIL